jgi:hypothetical protein
MIRLSFRLGSDLSSRLIAWYGQGYGGWSHVAAVLPDGTLLDARSDVLGGVPAGVQIRTEDLEPVRRSALVELEKGDSAAWEAFLRSQIGKPYDEQAILGFILGRKDHTKGRWICSALQTGALKAAGLLHSIPIPEAQVTPDALYLLVTAGLGGKIIKNG